MNRTLIKLLRGRKILKTGRFVLRGGEVSDYYCDIKEAVGDTQILNQIIRSLVMILPKEATCIACSGYGGITLGSIVAYKMKLPLVLVRNEEKKYGTKKVLEGYIPTNSDKVCIVDDVFTTGSSIKNTKEQILPTKAKFTKPVVVLNRSKSKAIYSLLNKEDFT